jgi:hypothetical protein
LTEAPTTKAEEQQEAELDKREIMNRILEAEDREALDSLSKILSPPEKRKLGFAGMMMSKQIMDVKTALNQIKGLSSLMMEQFLSMPEDQEDQVEPTAEENYSDFLSRCENLDENRITREDLEKLIRIKSQQLIREKESDQDYEQNLPIPGEHEVSEEEAEYLRKAEEEMWEELHKDDFNRGFSRVIDSISIDSPVFRLHQHFFVSQLILVYSLLEQTVTQLISLHCRPEEERNCRNRIQEFRSKNHRSPELENRIRLAGINLDTWKSLEIHWLRTMRDQFVHNLSDTRNAGNREQLIRTISAFKGITIKGGRIYLSKDTLDVYIGYARGIIDHLENLVL